MPEYLSSGVYVEEVSGGIKPIEGVGTSTGAFVGRAVKGPVDKAMLITNATQFAAAFGGFHPDYHLAYAVNHFFAEGGTRCYVVRVFKPNDLPPEDNLSRVARSTPNNVLRVLATSPGEWGNKIFVQIGPPAFDPGNVDPALPNDPNPKKRFSITVKYQTTPNGPAVTVETFSQLSMEEFTAGLPNPFHVEAQINGVSKYIEVQDLSHVVTVIEPPANSPAEDPNHPLAHLTNLTGGDETMTLSANDFIGGEAEANGLHAFDVVDDINIVAIPDLMHPNIPVADARDATIAGFTYCQNRKDCFFVADPPNASSPQDVLAYKQGKAPFSGAAFNSTFGALYYPWI